MTRLTLEIQDLSRRSPLTSIDVPDLNSSTRKEGGTHVEISKPPYRHLRALT